MDLLLHREASRFCQPNKFENKPRHQLSPQLSDKKDVPRLILLRAEQPLKLVRRPTLYVGNFVRIEKIDNLFEKVINNPSLTKFLKYLTYEQGTHRLIILSALLRNQQRVNFMSPN